MSERQKSILVDLIIGLVIAVLVFFLNFSGGYSIFHLLSDSFFVPAVVLLGIGGVGLCTNSGSLDMMGYGFSTLRDRFKKIGTMDGPDEDFFTYSQRKAGERKPYGHYLISGGIYLVISMAFLAAYNLFGA